MGVVSIGKYRHAFRAYEEQTMHTASVELSMSRPSFWPPILAGGITAGGLDLISAYIAYGIGVPRVIAAGLLGTNAIHGGSGAYALGLFLQFFIAVTAAAIYYAASRRLEFLKQHALVCGLFYGIVVFLVMNLIILPLSALHVQGPFELAGLIRGLLVHMFLVGLPISFSVKRFST